MKRILNLAVLLLGAISLKAQLVLENGAVLKTTGAALLTLQDIDVWNEGFIAQAKGGKIVCSGNNTNTIVTFTAANSEPQFDTLEIAKKGNAALLLEQSINIEGAVKFTSGVIDLTSSIIKLAPSASVQNETELSHTISTPQSGLPDGYITITNLLNAPVAANPGNLGAIITSSQNLGSTTIKRGHTSQVNAEGAGSSINRYYDIDPANNTALNATLRINYLDAELNSLTEADLTLWKSNNQTNWLNMGVTSRSEASNYAEKTGIADFSRWTLSSINNPLTVKLVSFQAACKQGDIVLTWTTDQEKNVVNFKLQNSEDAIAWSDVATIPFSEGTHKYNYSHTSSKEFYRLVIVSKDGQEQHSAARQLTCNTAENNISFWPNPVSDRLFIKVNATASGKMHIRLLDSKGVLVGQRVEDITPGENQLGFDVQNLPAGIYWMDAEWNNGINRQSIKLIKQGG